MAEDPHRVTPHGIPAKQETPWERLSGLRRGLQLIAIPQQHLGCVRMERELKGTVKPNAQLINREINAYFLRRSAIVSVPTS